MEAHSLIEPNSWVALRLPNGTGRLLQIVPNMIISLGRYGSFPSNLILHRPYHLTYELNEKSPSSDAFTRLRVVPASELHADVLAEEDAAASSSSRPDSAGPEEPIISATDGIEYSLVDNETGAVVVRSNREIIDDNARQTLTWQEIEALKRDGTDSGKDLIAKLMLSHTGMDKKTTFSMAKYKLLKEKKFLRRFTVLPLDVSNFGSYALHERDSNKILEMREEMVGLLGCWANVHYSSVDQDELDATETPARTEQEEMDEIKKPKQPEGTRYLVVDDTGGFLVAALAERMGILYPKTTTEEDEANGLPQTQDGAQKEASAPKAPAAEDTVMANTQDEPQPEWKAAVKRDHDRNPKDEERPKKHNVQRKPDFHIPFATTNTMTLVHTNGQPNLTALNYWGYDSTNPNHPPHPLLNHLLPLSWLQLLEPEMDTVYATEPAMKTADEVASWKPNRRGNYHRKRRRWARTRHIADTARAGGFSGLVVASVMDPISVLRPLLPLVASGAPVAIYSPHVEPLAQLADCFSVARRAAFMAQPEVAGGRSAEELERWEGTDDFPLNPALLLGVQLHTSRGRKWQVLPGRTHPIMTAKGGAEGCVLTGWKARPAEGKIAARGKFQKKGRSAGIGTAEGTPSAGAATGAATPASAEA
ncbi:tRNA (Adenine-N(1)-)-methyltransferase non-catalytic subunit trm6 [Diaporthe helianthi]|uniref:tRNA (adenine(58)-N(1))-methyltransferase non-catalytic subunit TRM6 n=1 Tax=Diaporthe helianthi TaxID=158607 RepID=A0A2P5HT38_DIAHE|nr:tRNA (Adenine-N(1)-)-methyltransferase non-catalytic subunit trm6 [Diaporthe helianthi]